MVTHGLACHLEYWIETSDSRLGQRHRKSVRLELPELSGRHHWYRNYCGTLVQDAQFLVPTRQSCYVESWKWVVIIPWSRNPECCPLTKYFYHWTGVGQGGTTTQLLINNSSFRKTIATICADTFFIAISVKRQKISSILLKRKKPLIMLTHIILKASS